MQPGEARFGLELDWEKPWRDQVFGAKMSETNGNRRPFFSRDSEAAFGSESATREARFGLELDWEKPWRDQVFGAKMSETNGNRRPFFF